MKKMLVFLTLFFILILNHPTQNFSLLNYFSGEYCSYTRTPVSDSYINLGFCYMGHDRAEANTLVGESMVIYNFEAGAAIKTLRATIIKTEVVNNATIIYANSPLINSSVTIEGKKINLQIANYSDHSVIGWPLILGSF